MISFWKFNTPLSHVAFTKVPMSGGRKVELIYLVDVNGAVQKLHKGLRRADLITYRKSQVVQTDKAAFSGYAAVKKQPTQATKPVLEQAVEMLDSINIDDMLTAILEPRAVTPGQPMLPQIEVEPKRKKPV